MITFKKSFKNIEDQNKYNAYLNDHVNIIGEIVEGEADYLDNLGWFSVDKWANEGFLSQFKALATEIREKADVFILIGVGGSNNAARSVIEALQVDGPEIIYSGNTLSPHQFNKVLAQLEGKSVYMNCIAKNFETLEPGSSFRVLRQYIINQYGEEEAAKRIIATGSRNSSLEQLCKDNGYTFLEFPEDVGGRFTSMTSVGLLPMAVAGLDIDAMVSGARDMQQQLHNDKTIDNQAYRYASYRNFEYENGYKVEMLASFEPQFRWFNKWWLQLFGESEGKDSKGILPTYAEYSEDLHAIGQFIQDGSPIVFETFIDVKKANASLVVKSDDKKDYFDYLDGKDFWQINKIAFEATFAAHSEKLPCAMIEVDEIDAYNFGQLFYFFQFACYLSCTLMGVNPFNQPGVEAYKQLMFTSLKK
ncbi:glucose-6-phosphate isomerase [Streptococcus moroccensis]|uniref:Glucose-6-phosphate isomerase n=1 Tax=Streptococcus moroccensis TaxID=1451356 RepID=A0ABT9YRI1_9STRE|nr:glucose-6-phosphate isomerase [Streptococcus moroccensis]MDQ0222599.1 glucose-6-phosphate isomerase [Streptococcus moroccensis]